MLDPNCFKAEYLGDIVWFVLDNSYKSRLPPDAIIYTLDEAQILAKKSEQTRKQAHEAKKVSGAIVNG